MAAIDKMVDDIRYKGQILARTNKVESAISGNALLGFAVGVLSPRAGFLLGYITWIGFQCDFLPLAFRLSPNSLNDSTQVLHL